MRPCRLSQTRCYQCRGGFRPGDEFRVMGAAFGGGKWDGRWSAFGTVLKGCCTRIAIRVGGLVPLSLELVENLDPPPAGFLARPPGSDPFHAPATNQAGADLSDELLKRLQAEGIEAVISAVGSQGLEILYRAASQRAPYGVYSPVRRERYCGTAVSIGFNTALSVTIEMLNKAYQAARSARKNCGGGGHGRASRVDCAAGRHCHPCRCGADP